VTTWLIGLGWFVVWLLDLVMVCYWFSTSSEPPREQRRMSLVLLSEVDFC